MTEKLKPCPFCGNEAYKSTTYTGNSFATMIWCYNCNISMTKLSYNSDDCTKEAIEAWNRRAE